MPDKTTFSNVLLVSVPSSDKDFVKGLFPGEYIEASPLSRTLARKYQDISILSVSFQDSVSKETLKVFSSLKAVITRSDGYDHLPLDWMKAHAIAGYFLGDYSVEGVSEFTTGLIISLLRRIPEGNAVTKKLRWDRSHLVNQSLKGTTIGVLGTGRIGAAVVRLLLALGANVIGYDIIQNKALEKLKRFQYINKFQSFLSQSQVLTTHVPLTNKTKGMIGKKEIKLLPQGAYIVNTARGEIIDQAAVEETLQSGHLAGYGADVLPCEPHPPDLKRFKNFNNVILTPHLAAYNKDSIYKRYEYTAKTIRAILDHKQKTIQSLRVV
ncbi:D-isomer specific 2-hydroxyacid dehydrogenase family protein [Patescibacteria group bacterium AH-259-L07]|nr:D-isomer specific 2-hydroxyacid dehydrogenase family protein [Patescibacteria group bacterium AH-259-L07]